MIKYRLTIEYKDGGKQTYEVINYFIDHFLHLKVSDEKMVMVAKEEIVSITATEIWQR